MAHIVVSVCPKCHRKDGWSVWLSQAGTIMGTCHRATCAFGSRALGPEYATAMPREAKKEPRHFTRPVRPLTTDHLVLLVKKFGSEALAEEVIGYSYWDDRFVLGVYGPRGYNRRGVIAYSFNAVPKTLPYNEKPAEPFIHYTGCTGMETAPAMVIVEDWFSAEKVGLTGAAIGVSLNGSYLSQEAVTEIAGEATRLGARVYLALDKDAYVKTLGYVSRYREQFPLGLYAWSLAQDLKYETSDRIKRGLDGAFDFIRNAQAQGNV